VNALFRVKRQVMRDFVIQIGVLLFAPPKIPPHFVSFRVRRVGRRKRLPHLNLPSIFLFQPQRLHRIDAGGAPGGQKRRGCADAEHDGEYHREGHGIARFYTIKNALQESAGG
jgi:hypothetical protein